MALQDAGTVRRILRRDAHHHPEVGEERHQPNLEEQFSSRVGHFSRAKVQTYDGRDTTEAGHHGQNSPLAQNVPLPLFDGRFRGVVPRVGVTSAGQTGRLVLLRRAHAR